MRWSLSILLLLALAVSAHAESAKVIKVLPHYLDKKGRSSVHPSLFERDAYQAELRASEGKRSALRFDVQWRARGYDELILRVEARGIQARQLQKVTLEQPVKSGWFSKWTSLKIAGDEYKAFGDMTAWRATLWNGTNMVAEQKSFLW